MKIGATGDGSIDQEEEVEADDVVSRCLFIYTEKWTGNNAYSYKSAPTFRFISYVVPLGISPANHALLLQSLTTSPHSCFHKLKCRKE